jgi:hypothetical protein
MPHLAKKPTVYLSTVSVPNASRPTVPSAFAKALRAPIWIAQQLPLIAPPIASSHALPAVARAASAHKSLALRLAVTILSAHQTSALCLTAPVVALPHATL